MYWEDIPPQSELLHSGDHVEDGFFAVAEEHEGVVGGEEGVGDSGEAGA